MRPAAVLVLALMALAPGPSDLDSFMQQVLDRRDDNWKKLQQYVLDERERMELRGPSERPVWGQQREFTWYFRDGYFIRSPVRFNGVAISERDRQKYEEDFLRRSKEHDHEADQRATESPVPPADIQSLIKQTREPQFISSAYFLQFKFEPGHYALVGREKLDAQEVLKIEYYPAQMFSGDPKTRTERRVRQTAQTSSEDGYQEQILRLMNKASLVTLWVEPNQHQIVKFTFENAGLDFLPAAWLARITGLRATMVMSEAFPGVWLPKRVDTTGSVVLATGRLDVQYTLDYTNYQEATVTTKIRGAVR